jgi:hypothetical protein
MKWLAFFTIFKNELPFMFKVFNNNNNTLTMPAELRSDANFLPNWLLSVFGAKHEPEEGPRKQEPSPQQLHLISTKMEAEDTEEASDELLPSGDSAEENPWHPLRSRSFLDNAQISHLLAQYKCNPFPSKYEMSSLAEQIHVNKRVVQVILFLKFWTKWRNFSAKKTLLFFHLLTMA